MTPESREWLSVRGVLMMMAAVAVVCGLSASMEPGAAAGLWVLFGVGTFMVGAVSGRVLLLMCGALFCACAALFVA